MLTIHVSHDALASKRYFSESLVKEGNYYMEPEIKAFWYGETAQKLGLGGEVVHEHDFARLVANINPQTGERLTVRSGQNRRSSVDFTFSAPKALSIAYAFTKDPDILKAHQIAYIAAMSKVEAMMYTQNNTREKRGFTHTGNIIYAAFDHELARPIEIEKDGGKQWISQMNLHTHCVMPTVTFNPETNRYEAVEIYNAHVNSAYIAAVYHSTLALELEHLGYQTERTAENFTLSGVSRDLVERFSARSQEINKIALEKNLDAKAKGELGAKTRAGKDELSLSQTELERYWRSELTSAEYDQIISLKGRAFDRQPDILIRDCVDQAMDHLMERQSVINEKKIIAQATSHAFGQYSIEDMEAELERRDNIVRSEEQTIQMATTRERIFEEDRLLSLAVTGKGQFTAINKDYKPKLDYLNDQQRSAIADILSTKDQLIILRGAAGVGKSSLLTEVRQATEQTGKQIHAVAPSSQASHVLSEKGFKSSTLANMLSKSDLQNQLKGNVWLVDEAGMCSVPDMLNILEVAKQQQARVILSGDSAQHGSVVYGDALRLLEQNGGVQVASVNKIVRQKEKSYNRAVTVLAKGQIHKGYKMLETQGKVKEISEAEARIDALADEYVQSLKQKQSVMIVSPTNYEGDLINAQIREKLKQNGKLKGQEKQFQVLRDLSLTEAQKRGNVHYEKGQIIRFVRNAKGGFKAGGHYEVQHINKEGDVRLRDPKNGMSRVLPKEFTNAYGVFTAQNIPLAKGERIRLSNNAKSLEGTKMVNGTSYEVKGFTKNGIRLSNGKVIASDWLHIRYDYCMTSYAAQGRDSQKVILSMSDISQGGINERSFYVAASRGVKDISIYCSDKDMLEKAITRNAERMGAKDFARQAYHDQMFRQIEHSKYQSLKRGNHEIKKGRTRDASRSISENFARA